MRNLLIGATSEWRQCTQRVLRMYGGFGDGSCGVFECRSPTDNRAMHIVASSGEGWDHVSVSHPNRCPNWAEMEFVKRAFFKDDETAMQLHVPSKEHINCHPYCLHLWRPTESAIPMPPGWMVGPQAAAA